MSGVEVRWPVQDGGDVWTPRAVAGLIGQRPRLTKNFVLTGPQVRTEVIDARIDGDVVIVTLDMPDEAAADVGAFLPRLDNAGGGYSIDNAALPDPPDGTRLLLDVALREVSDRG